MDGRGTDGVFAARTGTETTGEPQGPRRAAELRAAVDGLRGVRRLTNQGATDPLAVPAAWERLRPVRAVSLLLEAEGLPPSALDAGGAPALSGYRVDEGERPGCAQVRWVGPRGSGARHEERERLRTCAEALRGWGFWSTEVRGPGGRHHLEVEPVG